MHATIIVKAGSKTYTCDAQVTEPGNGPLPMIVNAVFTRLCEDQPEIMEAKTLTIKAKLKP